MVNRRGAISLPNDRGPNRFEAIEVLEVRQRSCKKQKAWQDDRMDLTSLDKIDGMWINT